MTMTSASPVAPARLPSQIPYIIGNEACERFSFYGMRNILTMFLISTLLMNEPEAERAGMAKEVFHSFVIGVYFFPLLGGWLADRFFGKYNTVLWMSLVYCLGHACLAVFEHYRPGFYTGLFLIALGSGGIKPLVVTFVGDQFTKSNKDLAKIVFDAFYWSINFGSFFASLLMPVLLAQYGSRVAFGIPGILMFIATVLFWMGRRKYVRVPPAPADPHSFLRVAASALFARAEGQNRPGLALAGAGVVAASIAIVAMPVLGFVSSVCLALVFMLAFGGVGVSMQLDRVRGQHPNEAVEGARAVLKVLVIFALVTPFWSLFDQKASTWVLQAESMTKPSWFHASQMQALNPALVMILIPFNNLILYPSLRRLGIELTALRRMGAGIAVAALAWIAAGVLQLAIDGGNPVSITWQILPYVLLTLGEVLVYATGLEFAYTQAPAAMKGVIMAFWYLSITVGNLWVLLVNGVVRNETVTASMLSTGLSEPACLMFFFAAFALIAAAAFALYAKRYRMQEFYLGA